MILKKLKVENFGPIESVEIEFKPGTNALLAANGSGKTNLLNALQLVFSGAKSLPKPLGWYFRGYGHLEGVKTARVEVEAEHRGQKLVIKRSFSVKTPADLESNTPPSISSRASYSCGDISVSSMTEVQKCVAGLTGAGDLTNVFVAQHESGLILKAGRAEREKLMEALSGSRVCADAAAYATRRLPGLQVVNRGDELVR